MLVILISAFHLSLFLITYQIFNLSIFIPLIFQVINFFSSLSIKWSPYHFFFSTYLIKKFLSLLLFFSCITFHSLSLFLLNSFSFTSSYNPYTSHASSYNFLTLHMLFPYKFLHFTCFSLQLLTLHMLLLTDSYTSHASPYRSLHFTCLFLQILTLLTSPYMTSRYYCKKMS